MPAQLLLLGGKDGRLTDVSAPCRRAVAVLRRGRGLAAGDLDNDGRLDLVIVAEGEPLVFFHNQGPARPLRDPPARRDPAVQPRCRRRTCHHHGGRPPPGRPAVRRRQLSVGVRPAAPLRPGRATRIERSRSAGPPGASIATPIWRQTPPTRSARASPMPSTSRLAKVSRALSDSPGSSHVVVRLTVASNLAKNRWIRVGLLVRGTSPKSCLGPLVRHDLGTALASFA